MAFGPVTDEDYASSEDSDFAPEDAADRESSAASADEEDVAADEPAVAKRRRQPEDGDAELENSGDEAVIERGKKRRKRAKAKDGGDQDDREDGSVIKTRSQRALE